MPIRLRLAVLFAVGTAAVAVIGGVVFVNELSGGLRNSVLTSLQVRAAAVSQQLPDSGGSGSGFQDPGLAPGSAGSLGSEDITQIIDRQDRVVDASGPVGAHSLLNAAQLDQARRHPLVVEMDVVHQPQPFLMLATTASDNGSSIVVVGASLGTVNDAIERVIAEIVVGGLAGVVVAGIAAWLLAGAALRPVERMRRQAAELSEHDTDATLPIPASRDEIAALGTTLNGLLGRLHGALNRQRGFVSAAGHELRGPLAILKSELELADRPGRSHAELTRAIELAGNETDRIIRLADDLFLLSRGDEGALPLHRTPTDLRSLVETSVESFSSRAEQGGITFEVTGSPSPVVEIDEQRCRQIIDNLLDNAVQHSPRGSTITVSLEHSDSAVVLNVADEGTGFPEEFLPRAFERFSRPDESRSRDAGGTGLGLAIVKSLAEAHGGSVKAANGPNGGAVVTVVIPVSMDEGDATPTGSITASEQPRPRNH